MSETDDNSDSVDSIMDGGQGRSHFRHRHAQNLVPMSRSKRVTQEKSVVRLSPNYVLAPECKSVISGSVTTVHVEGNNSVSVQLSKLQVQMRDLLVFDSWENFNLYLSKISG